MQNPFRFLLVIVLVAHAAFADGCRSGYTISDIDDSSLVYTFGGDVCYVNLVSGSVSGTINLKHNNETYHGVN